MSGSVSFAPAAMFDQTMEEAFPVLDPLHEPCGSSVLVQIRSPKTTTKGGIILTGDVQDTIKWNTQIAKVIAVGPVAFRNRVTLEPWPEGAWFKVGDFVRAPKYGGDRWEVAYTEQDKSEHFALFVLFNDLDIKARVKGDPRQVIAFV
jgi:co-chaperonin GroES (HSP10)